MAQRVFARSFLGRMARRCGPGKEPSGARRTGGGGNRFDPPWKDWPTTLQGIEFVNITIDADLESYKKMP